MAYHFLNESETITSFSLRMKTAKRHNTARTNVRRERKLFLISLRRISGGTHKNNAPPPAPEATRVLFMFSPNAGRQTTISGPRFGIHAHLPNTPSSRLEVFCVVGRETASFVASGNKLTRRNWIYASSFCLPFVSFVVNHQSER